MTTQPATKPAPSNALRANGALPYIRATEILPQRRSQTWPETAPVDAHAGPSATDPHPANRAHNGARPVADTATPTPIGRTP